MTDPRRSARSSVKKWLRPTVLAAVLALPSGLLLYPSQLALGQDAQAQYASADQLKQQAIGAARTGKFDETQRLIEEALRLRPDDAGLRRMEDWIGSFQQKRQEFSQERHKLYEQQVRDVKLLQDNGYRSYAISAATGAHLFADDKDKFRSEPWVRELITESAKLGEQYEQKSEWLKAMRVWSDLASIEEMNPLWKNRLKGATRRVRLLAIYTPEILDELRVSTQDERDAVDTLLREARRAEGEAPEPEQEAQPTTRQADEPAQEPTSELDESFRTDWHDAVSGITRGMLRDGLLDAQQYYVQPAVLRDMMVGGYDGLIALATTPGLERAFPSLGDPIVRDAFIAEVKQQRQGVAARDRDIDRGELNRLLSALAVANQKTLKLQEEVLVSEFADGALATLDPFTNMIWPSQIAEFTKGTQGEFVGVGIQIRSEDNGDLRVVSPLPDSPAYEAGIQPNDVITHIDGKNAKGLSDSQAVNVITGKPNTPVTLTVRNVDGVTKDYTLLRRKINVVSVKGWKQLPGGKWDFFVDPDEKIAYLRLTNFQKSTADELVIALRQLAQQGARGVILDLRYNPGGLLQSAVEVTDQFIGDGLIVRTKADRDVEVTPQAVHHAKVQRSDVDLPLVVLLNEYSASASEIVGGALKDHERALVVGTRTFGKGSVQMLYLLGNDNKACLKLTTAHYYLPSGRNIHKDDLDTEWGVDPDVVVEMIPQQMRDAISARQALDVLRDQQRTAEVSVNGESVDAETALLEADAQLAAALLVMRMQLLGAA